MIDSLWGRNLSSVESTLVAAMVVTTVQLVTQTASEGLNAKFSDLCDPHDLPSIRATKKTIAKHTARSRASRKGVVRHIEKHERGASMCSSTDDDAFLMSFMPMKTEPKLFRIPSGFSVGKLTGSPSSAMHLYCSPPRIEGRKFTNKLLKLCTGTKRSKYVPLPVY
uniref:Uncharacterized protein n=1 Tax=Physcomitrium patens TaxID=3218 RepID=A0A2K1KN87_PHYPA|nr:hypothetical protein PHYPA_006140 [Physcomitrium patens]